MYRYTAGQGLLYNGRHIPHVIMLAEGGYGHQTALDILAHFFKDEADPERKALALYKLLSKRLFETYFGYDGWTMSEGELLELVTLILCEQRERVNGKSDLVYLDGQRRDTLRLQ